MMATNQRRRGKIPSILSYDPGEKQADQSQSVAYSTGHRSLCLLAFVIFALALWVIVELWFRPVTDASFNRSFCSYRGQNIELSRETDALFTCINKCTASKRIIITFSNYGFIQFVYNWIHYLELQNLDEYIIFALDKSSYIELSAKKYNVFYEDSLSVSEKPQAYLKDSYKKLVNLKTRYNYEILKRGFNTLLSDSDIVFLKDPWALLRRSTSDIQIQDDRAYVYDEPNVNTGFQFVMSNENTVRFYKQVVQVTERYIWNLQDQAAYNWVIEWTNLASGLQMNLLDRTLFPNGYSYFVNRESEKDGISPVIVHINWITGYYSKIYRLLMSNWWSIRGNSTVNAKYLTYTPSLVSQPMEDLENELQCAISIATKLNRHLLLPKYKVPLSFQAVLKEMEYCSAEYIFDIDEIFRHYPSLIPLENPENIKAKTWDVHTLQSNAEWDTLVSSEARLVILQTLNCRDENMETKLSKVVCARKTVYQGCR